MVFSFTFNVSKITPKVNSIIFLIDKKKQLLSQYLMLLINKGLTKGLGDNWKEYSRYLVKLTKFSQYCLTNRLNHIDRFKALHQTERLAETPSSKYRLNAI